jgi:hypothetical protein
MEVYQQPYVCESTGLAYFSDPSQLNASLATVPLPTDCHTTPMLSSVAIKLTLSPITYSLLFGGILLAMYVENLGIDIAGMLVVWLVLYPLSINFAERSVGPNMYLIQQAIRHDSLIMAVNIVVIVVASVSSFIVIGIQVVQIWREPQKFRAMMRNEEAPAVQHDVENPMSTAETRWVKHQLRALRTFQALCNPPVKAAARPAGHHDHDAADIHAVEAPENVPAALEKEWMVHQLLALRAAKHLNLSEAEDGGWSPKGHPLFQSLLLSLCLPYVIVSLLMSLILSIALLLNPHFTAPDITLNTLFDPTHQDQNFTRLQYLNFIGVVVCMLLLRMIIFYPPKQVFKQGTLEKLAIAYLKAIFWDVKGLKQLVTKLAKM